MHQYLHYWDPRRRREKGSEKIFEKIIAENFPNMEKEIAKFRKNRVPGRINTRRNTLK